MNGGEIDFVFTANTDQLEKVFKDAEKGLLGLSDIAKKAGEGIDSVFDISKENINIQKQVIGELESKYKDLSKAIEEIAPGTAKLTMMKEAASIKAELEAEKKSLIELETNLKSTETTYKSFQSKLNEVKNEMRELEIAGQQNSSRYAELSQKAAEYQKANESVNKSLKALKDNAGLTALVETMGLASGIFSTYQGITALVGKENEDLEKITIRLQSAIAVTVGIQQVQNSLSKESSLLQSIQAVQTLARAKADEIAAVSTGKATIAQRAFNLVAKANPYVLLATAILSVVGAVYLFTRRTDEASNIQKKMNDALKESASNTAKELVELEKLYRTATNDKISREQRLKAVNALKAAYPGQLSLIREEIILNGKAADSYIALKNAILEKAKANAAQKVVEDAYSEQLKNQQGYFDELNTLYGRTAEIKKRIQKDGQFSEVDGIFGNKVRVDNYEKLRQTRERIAVINKEVGSQNKELDKKYKGVVNTIVTGNAAIDAATTAPPPNKGTGEWYKEEISRLEELRQKAIVGSAEWKKLGKQIENYQNLLNPKSSSPSIKSTSSPNSVADEYLPEGSVAEIQRRLSKIDEALSKATTDSQRNDLKAKRISTAKELAEAEKLIQIKTLQEQFDESEKLWQQYYSAVESIGKPKADEIFGDAIKNDKSSYDALIKQRDDLKNKANLTDEERNYFSFIDEKINSMLGKQSKLEIFKQTIEETLSTLGTDAEKLKFIEEQKTTANKTTGEYAILKDYDRKIVEEQKKRYQEFLAAHQSFEERRNSITENYATLRQTIEADATLNNEQKKNALEKAAQEEADAYSDAFMNELLNNPQLREAFVNLERQTTVKLLAIKKKLEESLLDKNLNSEALEKIRRDIESINQVLATKNPFEALTSSYKSYVNALEKRKEAESKFGKDSKEFAETQKDVESNAKSLAGAIDIVIEYGKIASDALLDVGVSIGLINEDTKQLASDIFDVTQNLGKALIGVLTKDPKAIIQGVAGAIKGIANIINGDGKRERKIKEWADQVANLKLQYEELEKAVSKALGEDKYKAQQTVIANLKEQKRLLEQMMQKEIDKKKTDQNKVNDYKSQIASINSQIEDIQNNIIKNILQTDAQSAASKLGDALVNAFSKGEDGAKAMRDVANDMFRDIVKNALNMKLQKAMQPILNDMLKAMGYDENGNGSFVALTDAKMEEFRKRIEEAGEFGQNFLNQWAKLYEGLDNTSPNGLKGDIKGITEKTAGALEAQINAIRIYQVENLNIAKRSQQLLVDSLKHQAEIAFNTRELKAIRQGIDDLVIKVKKL